MSTVVKMKDKKIENKEKYEKLVWDREDCSYCFLNDISEYPNLKYAIVCGGGVWCACPIYILRSNTLKEIAFCNEDFSTGIDQCSVYHCETLEAVHIEMTTPSAFTYKAFLESHNVNVVSSQRRSLPNSLKVLLAI